MYPELLSRRALNVQEDGNTVTRVFRCHGDRVKDLHCRTTGVTLHSLGV